MFGPTRPASLPQAQDRGAHSQRAPSSVKVVLQKHLLVHRVRIRMNLAPTGSLALKGVCLQILTSEPSQGRVLGRESETDGLLWKAERNVQKQPRGQWKTHIR